MPSKAPLLVAALLAALFTGCFDQDRGPNPTATSTPSSGTLSTTSTSSNSSTGAPPPLAPPNELILSDCVGWTAFRNYITPTSPGNPLEGWDPAPPGSFDPVSLRGFRCARIAVGSYERGPIHIITDAHSNSSFPDTCADEQKGLTGLRVLEHFIVSDLEIADYLAVNYGMPTLVATFQETEQDLAASALHTFSWSIGSEPPSSITVLDDKQNGHLPTVFDRYFWRQGPGVALLEIETDQDGAVANLIANGTVQPPHLLAQDTQGVFVGQGDWRTNLESHGLFTLYQDLSCEAPVA